MFVYRILSSPEYTPTDKPKAPPRAAVADAV